MDQATKMTAEVYKAVKPIWTQIDRLYPAICAIEGATLALSEMAEPQRGNEAIAADAIFWLADRLKEHVEALKQQHRRCYDAAGITPKSPVAAADDGSESIADLYRRWKALRLAENSVAAGDDGIIDKLADQMRAIERQLIKIRATNTDEVKIKIRTLPVLLGQEDSRELVGYVKEIEADLTALAGGSA